MKILMVNNFAYVTGGADTHVLGLFEGLRRSGHDVRLVATESYRNVVKEGSFVRCAVTNETRDGLSAAQRLAVARRALWNQEAFAATRRIIRQFQPDVVHAHKLYPQLSAAPLVAARSARIPIVQTVHDYELVSASSLDERGSLLDRHESRGSYRLLNTATYPIRRFLYRPLVAEWTAVSRNLASIYSSAGITSTVIPNFVVPGGASELPTFHERTGIAFVGRLTKEKGVSDALAFARLLPEVPLVVAGWGPEEEVVRAAAASASNIRFVGRLDPGGVRKLLRGVRLRILPSGWAEPGGLMVVETIAEGTPVVAYDRGGAAEYVRDSRAGIVVDPAPRSLADAAVGLYSSALTWAVTSRAGVSAASDQYGVDAHIRSLERVFERAVAG